MATIAEPTVRDLRVTESEHQNWERIGDGVGVDWPDIDEDVSILGMLFWGARATAGRTVPQVGIVSFERREADAAVDRGPRLNQPRTTGAGAARDRGR